MGKNQLEGVVAFEVHQRGWDCPSELVTAQVDVAKLWDLRKRAWDGTREVVEG